MADGDETPELPLWSHLDLDCMGMEPATLERWLQVLARPSGLVVITGPTGAGKSTVAHASLLRLRRMRPRAVIMAAEIIEVRLHPSRGIQQVPSDFGDGPDSFARQTDRFVAAGAHVIKTKIESFSMADSAMRAVDAGCLVLASMHTRNAFDVPGRLRDMIIQTTCPFQHSGPTVVADHLAAVLTRRLVGVLCPVCKTAYRPSAALRDYFHLGPGLLARLGLDGLDLDDLVLYRPGRGCSMCRLTGGYVSRTGVFELAVYDDGATEAIRAGASADDLHRIGCASGTTTLRESGLRKALLGVTSLEEVTRVTDGDADHLGHPAVTNGRFVPWRTDARIDTAPAAASGVVMGP